MHLDKFVHSKTGKIIMSILLGFGLATIFRTICKDNNCIIRRAPPLDKIKDKIFKTGDNCVKYTSVTTKCDSTKNPIEFE